MNVAHRQWSRRTRALLWAAALGLMVMIFCFSAQPGDDSAETSGQVVKLLLRMFVPGYESLPAEQSLSLLNTLQLVVRKTAHFAEYLLLGLALRLLTASYALRHGAGIAWAAGTLYAVTDEVHQLFVGERAGAWQDVLLDSAGAAAGAALVGLCLWLHRRGREKCV